LLGTTPKDVEADRFGALARAVKETGSVVLLKGARTLIGGPDELPIVNPTGNPALATAGSGDVLAGILGALFANVREPLEAAALAAYVHGLAAERWVAAHGVDRGMVAHEIADGVPEVLSSLSKA
jgi:NAD(P)H-hydrate epimerase